MSAGVLSQPIPVDRAATRRLHYHRLHIESHTERHSSLQGLLYEPQADRTSSWQVMPQRPLVSSRVHPEPPGLTAYTREQPGAWTYSGTTWQHNEVFDSAGWMDDSTAEDSGHSLAQDLYPYDRGEQAVLSLAERLMLQPVASVCYVQTSVHTLTLFSLSAQ